MDQPLLADLLTFLDRSPTPWHAIREVQGRLAPSAGAPLPENSLWKLAPGQFLTTVRGGTALAAFRLPRRLGPTLKFRLLSAHTDSPVLQLKSHPVRQEGTLARLLVEPYGGGLWDSWCGRDLRLAGAVWTAPSGTTGTPDLGQGQAPHLIDFPERLQIPRLPIHLDPDYRQKGFAPDLVHQLLPWWSANGETDFLARLTELCRGATPLGWSLSLGDAAPASLCGARGEMISAPRIDDLALVHACLTAFLSAPEPEEFAWGLLLPCGEEVGSLAHDGADSDWVPGLLRRITEGLGYSAEAHRAGLADSLLVSADMAHAFHPGWADRYDPDHRPQLNGGPVLKSSAARRYATDGAGAARVRAVARALAIPLQEFHPRNGGPCGSTIGPIGSAGWGMPAVDLGNPMVSMHACRELAGARDHEPMVRLLRGLLES